MNGGNINTFMGAFHAFERRHDLFGQAINGAPWWDSVRYDACCFLFECAAGSAYAAASAQPRRRSRLGALRRAAYREMLLARSRTQRGRLMVLRAPRIATGHGLRDAVLDPLTEPFAGRTLSIDTLPRRYHLPAVDPHGAPRPAHPVLVDAACHLAAEFNLASAQAARLEEVIGRSRQAFETEVAGYHRLFAAARPAAVLLVQNGIEKALFHAARDHGVPTMEAQHGVVAFGHPQYSYDADVAYDRQTTFPDLFLTFSPFWQAHVLYPARRQEAIGTDHFARGIGPVRDPLGRVMVCSANIYHDQLVALTRQVAAALPGRRILYKLHPNQKTDEPAIRQSLADLANVEVGAALTPATTLMDDVSHLIAVQSTLVYEALQLGRRVCIVPGLDYAIHSNVFDLPLVTVADAVVDIAASLRVPTTGANAPVFFDRFDPNRALDVLSAVLGTRAQAKGTS